jgi:hypothetical protein
LFKEAIVSPTEVLERTNAPALLTDSGQKSWDSVMSYDFSRIRAKIVSEGSVEESRVDTAITEFRKFLGLIVCGYNGLGMTSREVDDVWHTFILFTCEYTDFCSQVFGHYLHHQPATADEPVDSAAGDLFRRSYGEVFGDLDPIWTQGGVLHSKCTVDCQSRCSGSCSTQYCTNS